MYDQEQNSSCLALNLNLKTICSCCFKMDTQFFDTSPFKKWNLIPLLLNVVRFGFLLLIRKLWQWRWYTTFHTQSWDIVTPSLFFLLDHSLLGKAAVMWWGHSTHLWTGPHGKELRLPASCVREPEEETLRSLAPRCDF